MEEFLNNNNINYIKDASFKQLASFKVGGKIKYLVYPNKDNISKLLEYLNSNNVDYYMLGGGTNFLPSSKDYDGVIIKLDNFKEVEINEDVITIGAGMLFSKVATTLVNDNYKYYAELSTIPGTIGGMLTMNAGAYGSSLSDVVIDALVYKGGNIFTINKDDMKLSYRNSIFKDGDYIILSVRCKLVKSEENEKEKMLGYITKRNSSQPLDKPNAGSIFKNPEGNYAGKLIEEANLKGYKIGGAKVSEKHANFIINDGNATSEDIYELIMYIKKVVKEKYGIELETEVKTFNF